MFNSLYYYFIRICMYVDGLYCLNWYLLYLNDKSNIFYLIFYLEKVKRKNVFFL